METGHLFARLSLDIGFTQRARIGRHVVSYGAISYFDCLGDPVPAELLELLKPDTIRFVVVMGKNSVNPHRDHHIITALNCYFQAGGATTHFWEPLPAAKPITFPGARTSNIYCDGNLRHLTSFTASDGEAYLLNVNQVHSVQRTSIKTRRFIQLSWKARPFEEVLEVCRAAGL